MYKITIWYMNTGDNKVIPVETLDKAERRARKILKDPLVIDVVIEEAEEEDYYLDALPEGYIEVEN